MAKDFQKTINFLRKQKDLLIDNFSNNEIQKDKTNEIINQITYINTKIQDYTDKIKI